MMRLLKEPSVIRSGLIGGICGALFVYFMGVNTYLVVATIPIGALFGILFQIFVTPFFWLLLMAIELASSSDWQEHWPND